LKYKIENQELFVPKDDKKITNVIIDYRELKEELDIIKNDNKIMRMQLE